MTPLAHAFTKDIALPERQRQKLSGSTASSLRALLSDIHCFEVTQTLPLLPEFGRMAPDDLEKTNHLLFLPAPKTWIEYLHRSGDRIGYLLEESSDKAFAKTTIFFSHNETNVVQHLGTISLIDSVYHRSEGNFTLPTLLWRGLRDQGYSDGQILDGLITIVHLFLLLINSPRIIGRTQFMPHRGLERRLMQAFGKGSFPLHAWTEIKLQVSKPIEIDDGEPHEAHLTGRRALHFVRKHVRIRLGRLEYVSAHWRGDAAIGIKQSRYSVVQ